jgi:hypothetical protein
MITLEDYKNWLKGYESLVKECEVQMIQANMVMPLIKAKIEELEELEEINKKQGDE